MQKAKELHPDLQDPNIIDDDKSAFLRILTAYKASSSCVCPDKLAICVFIFSVSIFGTDFIRHTFHVTGTVR